MKKIWLGIGAAVIIVLLLLQTKFSIYMRMEDSGCAVDSNLVKQMLMSDPEEVQEKTTVSYYAFQAMDYIYKRGNSFYIGENKKIQVDLKFPFYINGNAGILFTDDSGILFDTEFHEAEVYQGMIVSEGVAYNPGRERADAAEYLFSGLENGFFINLDTMSYTDRGELRQVAANSLIYFKESYFAYLEPDGEEGIYQICRTIKEDDLVTIKGQEYTYHELLVKLHILKEKEDNGAEEAEEEELQEDMPVEDIEIEEAEKDTKKEERVKEEKKEKTSKKTENKQQKPSQSVKPAHTEKEKKPENSSSRPSHGGNHTQVSPGVRPDEMRPDKKPDTDGKDLVVGYKKPVVEVTGTEAGVYRLMITVKVEDEARRLHPLKKVQFEFYEVGKNGKEKLVYRTYTGSSQTVTAGNGAIKPDTEYRVNAYFTYYDEYDEMVVESLLNTTMHTKSFDTLTAITLADRQIDIYYDNRVEIPGVKYEKGKSDEEAVYGINRSGGMILTVEGRGATAGFHSETIVDATDIRGFKNGLEVLLKSVPNLKANSKYSYKLEAYDYFGNKLELLNNKGEFETCKSRPIGALEIVENKIGDLRMQVDMTDPDLSAIPCDKAGNYNIYLLFSTAKNTENNPITKKECEAYLSNGGQGTENGRIDYVYQFSESEYKKYTGGNDFVIQIDSIIKADQLKLNKKYYAYLFCDYDLNNGAGPVEFGEVANLAFTSASLSSLGDIYIKADISNVTAHSAVITYTLNKERTNDVLESLLSSVRFDIVRGNGEEPVKDSYIEFDEEAMKVFTGYDHSTDPATETANGSVMMDASFFQGNKEGQNALKSMTDYTIQPEVWATYNGEKYPMNVTLTNTSFKTLREPARVEVTDLLLAAGTLRFHVTVKDPDEAITGNSGHMVVMNLYQQDGTFVKGIRIPKNQKEPYPVEITNLDVNAKFKLTFIAVEYNEGYTNATFESNKILKEILLSDSLNLSGKIKLQNIVETPDDGSKLLANTKVSIWDKDKVMQSLPYFIQVEKNGQDVTKEGGYPAAYTIGAEEYGSDNTVTHARPFYVDKGKNTYKLTLYVYINGQKLILDTLTFTSEQTVEGIGSAEEFIWKIKKNEGLGKYIITDDISMESDIKYADPDPEDPAKPKTATPCSIVNIFNGQIDFQGYTLSYNYKAAGSLLFPNLGPKSEISNMVFDIKTENYNSAVYNEGVLTRYNYGRIHDVVIHYKGGAAVSNTYFGLLCRGNAISGIIENFVIANEPEEGRMPFAGRYEIGLVCGMNRGIIRNGYVYGEDVIAAVGSPSRQLIRAGGIAGAQGSTGQISNVYSLVNVEVYNPSASDDKKTPVSEYGSIVGYDVGRLNNVYGIGQSLYNEPYQGTLFDGTKGPVDGSNNARSSQVFYWNENDYTYEKSLYQERISLESLHDYSWQAALLGNQFITSNVEIGYYPHVKLSSELPEQHYIPLPDRANAQLVEVMSATVLEYTDNEQAAIVEFRFSNTRNVTIQEIEIENLTTVIDTDTIVSADGYTTLQAKVSEPRRYCSSYDIKGVGYEFRGRKQKVTFDPAPILLADFYRNIYTPEDWYDYVVCAPTENARLQADIDFAGVDEKRIYVEKKYTGKLDGNKYRGKTSDSPEGYTIKNITITQAPNLFSQVTGEVKNLCVENITLGSTAAVGADAGLIKEHDGKADNIHMRNVQLTGYGNMGGIAAHGVTASQVSNSSINGIKILYKEPANTNTDGRIGGLVGYGDCMRINNCYVRDIDMEAEDIRNCVGAGGIVGYDYCSAVDGVYATGNMSVRGMRVGGIAGYYVTGDISNVKLTNVLSRVNVSSYQDKVGGIIGEATVDYILTERNNISGVALGNVYAENTNAESMSYTVGSFAGNTISFYGSEVQLWNGMTGQPKDSHTLDLLTYEELLTPETYTQKAGMDEVYDYSKAANGFLPVLYYQGTDIPLPFQTDTPLSLIKVQNNEIEVRDVGCNEEQRYIYLDLINPKGYEITGMKIEDLKYTFNRQDSGKLRIYADYLPENRQEHWKDSYLLTEITYQKKDEAGNITAGKADFSSKPVRIPLTLFCDIRNVDEWNQYINPDNNYGNYENYRIVNHISFTGVVPTTNAKIGRLRGQVNNGKAVLSNINIGPGYGTLKGNKENFIFRLNRELSNISFEHCTVFSSGRNCVGLIGTSAANIDKVDFTDITVDSKTNDGSYMGMIGYQISGEISNVTLKDIRVNQKGSPWNTGIGGLVGYSTSGTLYKNIKGEQIAVRGWNSLGGLLGKTNRACYDNIELVDIKVLGLGNNYIGGLVGLDTSTRTTTNTTYLWNVSIKGTPTYDAAGNMTDSTTVIGMSPNLNTSTPTGVYIGGVAGYRLGNKNGFGTSVSDKKPLLVEGAMINGYGSYLGGIFGLSYDAGNATVKDTLIRTGKTPKEQCYYVGGISGQQSFVNSYNTVENTVIDVQNHSRVGMIAGYKPNDGNTSFCFVKNSRLKVKRTITAGYHSEVGGLIGRNESPIINCGVVNTDVVTDSSINGAGYENVGGITGYASNYIYRSFYYAEPESSASPAAKEEYKIAGYQNVGGIAGCQSAGAVETCYSNGNVTAKGSTAGGLVGEYRNDYTVKHISSGEAYSYSNVALRYCYFAGTVHANKWAGGAIGKNQMHCSTEVAASHQTSGGRNATADASGHKSGLLSEDAYTYRNLIMAKSVTSDKAGEAHAFSGAQDGFEGRANGKAVSVDNTSEDKAKRTYFWEGMKVGGKAEENRIYYAKNTDAPETAKNSGTWRYKLWNKGSYGVISNEKANSDNCNVRIVSTEDIKNLQMFRALGWLTWTSGQVGHETQWKEPNGTYNGDTVKGDRYRFITSKVVSETLWNALKDADRYRGKDYLPHIRINTNGGQISDSLVLQQSDMGVAMPIPQWTSTNRETIAVFSAGEMKDTYGMIYPIDADKINLEFSQDLVDANGYFLLSYGNKVVDRQLITKRVYTYTYDYQAGLKLQYGVAEPERFMADMDAAGKVNGEDYMLEDIFDYGDDYCHESFEPIAYQAAALARHVMTYGSRYYYIDEGGIVYGTGSTVRENPEETENGEKTREQSQTESEKKEKITDESAQLLAGSYLTIYQGKALTTEGTVIDVESGAEIGSVSGINVLDNPIPLQSFEHEGFHIESYAKFAEAVSTEVVARESQILKGNTGVVGFVDGQIDNVKDSILLYIKDDSNFQTILGVDGIMVDMCQGENINAPEGFRNSGIVYMTNNLNCSAPFVLVEYANGGIVGYNYMTGEYLFDHSITNTMSLLDYTKVYFNGDKSMYAQMSNTYAANKKVADMAGTPERLFTMVTGNSTDTDIEGNSRGEGTESPHEKTLPATEDSAAAGQDKAMSQGDGTEEDTREKQTVAAEGGLGNSDNVLTASEASAEGNGGDGSAEGADTDQPGYAGEAARGNDEDNGLQTDADGYMMASTQENPTIIGEGMGNGEIIAAGTATGEGENEAAFSEGELLTTAKETEEIPDEKAETASEENDNEDVQKEEAQEQESGQETEEGETAPEYEETKAASEKAEKGKTGEESREGSEKEEPGKFSTAGTPVEKAAGGINNGEKSKRRSADDKEKQVSETPDTASEKADNKGKLVTVYNQSTGTYEIVDMNQYFSSSGYSSENVKLCIRDMSAYAGFAQEKQEKKHANGLALYVVVAAAVLAGTGLVIRYRRRHKLQ